MVWFTALVLSIVGPWWAAWERARNQSHDRLAGRTVTYAELQQNGLGPREVLLTFDDGPSARSTIAILETLAQFSVPATFFLIGNSALKDPATAKQLAAAPGATIGTHTQTHPDLTSLPIGDAMAEVEGGFASVSAAIAPAVPTRLFRCPYRASNDLVSANLSARGYLDVTVGRDPQDYAPVWPGALLRLAIAKTAGGGIVTFHDKQWRTAIILPRLLAHLEGAGFSVVQLVEGLRKRELTPLKGALEPL